MMSSRNASKRFGSIISRGGESHAVNGHDKQATADVPAPPHSWSLSF
jgi:hypothetical protein